MERVAMHQNIGIVSCGVEIPRKDKDEAWDKWREIERRLAVQLLIILLLSIKGWSHFLRRRLAIFFEFRI
ncbi:hypothetical protein NC651_010688 [Populus alba x Populus x berolinensis]|nr:hypothetical protein NC651_010688 [Populus alba x Populus x berolinensis]